MWAVLTCATHDSLPEVLLIRQTRLLSKPYFSISQEPSASNECMHPSIQRSASNCCGTRLTCSAMMWASSCDEFGEAFLLFGWAVVVSPGPTERCQLNGMVVNLLRRGAQFQIELAFRGPQHHLEPEVSIRGICRPLWIVVQTNDPG